MQGGGRYAHGGNIQGGDAASDPEDDSEDDFQDNYN